MAQKGALLPTVPVHSCGKAEIRHRGACCPENRRGAGRRVWGNLQQGRTGKEDMYRLTMSISRRILKLPSVQALPLKFIHSYGSEFFFKHSGFSVSTDRLHAFWVKILYVITCYI